jgi:hypothetical protein
MAESFFGALKNEWLNRTVFATKEQARREVVKLIEGFIIVHVFTRGSVTGLHWRSTTVITAPRRSRRPAVMCVVIGWAVAVTANSIGALHVMAIAQIRHATDGRVYYQRKLDERKPTKRPCGRSNGSCPMSSTDASSRTTKTGKSGSFPQLLDTEGPDTERV